MVSTLRGMRKYSTVRASEGIGRNDADIALKSTNEPSSAFPFRLQRRHVDDDAAARVGALAQADGQHAARNAEILDGARQREGIGRNDADIALKSTNEPSSKFLGSTMVELMFVKILNCRRSARRSRSCWCRSDNAPAIGRADLTRFKGFDHAGFGLAADPAVAFDAHDGSGARGMDSPDFIPRGRTAPQSVLIQAARIRLRRSVAAPLGKRASASGTCPFLVPENVR